MTALLNPPVLRPTPPPTPPTSPVPRPMTWTREQFIDIASRPDMHDRRLELIDGIIWEHEMMKPPHAGGLTKARRQLERAFTATWNVRVQAPLDLGADSLPLPDCAVVPLRADDYTLTHPTRNECVLVVEVADTTLQFDLTDKAERYASAGIRECWVVDVVNRIVHVLRDPGPLAANGTAYRDQRTLSPADAVAPLAAPDASVKVADLLP